MTTRLGLSKSVRVTLLPKDSSFLERSLQCVVCLNIGNRTFKAAYRVVEDTVCRKHVAKAIDRAFDMLDGSIPMSVSQLKDVRSKKYGEIVNVESIGVLEIPDPDRE